MSGDCKAESATKKFCSIRANPKCGDCKQPKTYVDVCKPSWNAFTYVQLVDGQGMDKKYEAHHILCVSPVTKELAGNTKIQKAIEETDWCINNGTNMIAMPLWGHTVKWYCKITRSRKFMPMDVPAPPFENLPQHNIDHNSKEGYTYEITKVCQQLVKDVQEAGHDLEAEGLEGALNDLSVEWEAEIKRRGTARKGGTHSAWKAAQDDPPDANWFEPFSMASDSKISKMGFPVHKFDDKVAAWIDRLANSMA
jgi:hypothetical protein